MSTLATLRDELKVRLATISGLHAHDIWPEPVVTPAAIVLPETVGVDATFSGEQFDTFGIVVIVQASNMRIAQDALDPYISRSGAPSIQAALEGDKALAGAAQFLIFDGWTEYGKAEIDGTDYLQAKGSVRVWH